jgi:hypothetical protein
MKKTKQEFVIPSPNYYTDEDRYLDDCLSVTMKEYPRDKAFAICKRNWSSRSRR